MGNGQNGSGKMLPVILGLAAVLCGVALLIGAINLGGRLAAFWVVLVFQALLALLATAVGLLVSAVLFGYLVKQIEKLRRDHRELLRRMQRRTPTFAAALGLSASAIMLVADKLFEDQKTITVLVSLLLLLAFWVANELMISESRTKKVFGVIIWILSLAYVPVAVLLQRGHLNTVLKELSEISVGVKVTFGLTALILLVMPFVLHWAEDTQEALAGTAQGRR